MATAYASAVIDAPIERVWDIVRDFNGLPKWFPIAVDSVIEDGKRADQVGCVRSFHTADGAHVRERLLSLDDAGFNLTYNFETPAFPVSNYLAAMRLRRVTETGATFAEWTATFDERPEDEGVYVELIAKAVFAEGWQALRRAVQGQGTA